MCVGGVCVCVCVCVCGVVCVYLFLSLCVCVHTCVVHMWEFQNCKQFSVTSLGSLVYGGSAYVFLMVMIHCNGTATRGLHWCRRSHN